MTKEKMTKEESLSEDCREYNKFKNWVESIEGDNDPFGERQENFCN